MVLSDKSKSDVMNNGFIDSVGAVNYPYQPEKHEIVGTSLLFPNVLTILSMGVCLDGTVLVTTDDKQVYRLPKSDFITSWGMLVVQSMVLNPELERFPAKLKVFYDKNINDFSAILE